MNTMIKKHILFILINLMPILLIAQYSNSKKQNQPFSNGLGASDYNFEVGTQAGFSSHNASFFTTYFSPSAKFDVTKKFSIVAGIGASFTQLNNVPVLNYDLSTQKTNATVSSIYSFASGIYQVNNKLNIYGGVLVEQVYTNPQGNYAPMNNRYKDVNIGINYNVNRHISFNAQIQFSDRPHSYSNSFQRTNGMNGFYGNSAFSSFY